MKRAMQPDDATQRDDATQQQCKAVTRTSIILISAYSLVDTYFFLNGPVVYVLACTVCIIEQGSGEVGEARAAGGNSQMLRSRVATRVCCWVIAAGHTRAQYCLP